MSLYTQGYFKWMNGKLFVLVYLNDPASWVINFVQKKHKAKRKAFIFHFPFLLMMLSTCPFPPSHANPIKCGNITC
jgi:hypothetical protein